MENRNKDEEVDAALKRSVEGLLARKRTEVLSAQTSRNIDPLIDPLKDMERENRRLQHLLGELLLKNQQLRAELEGREPEFRQSAKAL